MMNRLYILCLLLVCPLLSAQTVNYEQRYDLLVSKFGPAGIGVETVLDNWEKTDSANIKLLTARFNYYFTKSQSVQVVKKSQKRYLGTDPVLSLKDSTGADVYYYQESFFDDVIYGRALKAADKAIAMYPDHLDFRFLKANAYISYEKESPDMALAYLLNLADEDSSRKRLWLYDGKGTQAGFFNEAMLEYCYTFYSIGSSKSMEAFFRLSEKMNSLHPSDQGFMNNIGSYYMVARQDYKAALKWYGKVLKKHPEDYTAIRNSMLAARKTGNLKLEKKFLQMIVAHGPENEKRQAEARLKALDK